MTKGKIVRLDPKKIPPGKLHDDITAAGIVVGTVLAKTGYGECVLYLKPGTIVPGVSVPVSSRPNAPVQHWLTVHESRLVEHVE